MLRQGVVTEQALVQIRRGNKWDDYTRADQPQGKGEHPYSDKDSDGNQGIEQASRKAAAFSRLRCG